jgi:hypothetical protein
MTRSVRLPGPDRYELNARLKPALFCILPLLVVLAVWLPEVWTALGGLAALLSACGATLFLGQIARQRGRKFQEGRNGLGPESTGVMLSHSNSCIDPQTKARYHAFLRESGLAVPTAAEEQADPNAAGNCYRGCVTWLLSKTRDKSRFSLLAEENISYGFRRNLAALKPLALPILMFSLCLNTLELWAIWPKTETQFFIGAALECGLLQILVAWLFVINLDFVEDASKTFAQRLLSSCDEIEVAHGGGQGPKRVRPKSKG